MTEVRHGDLRLLQFPGLASLPGVVHAVTTRPQNMAPHRGQDREKAVHWRRRLCEWMAMPFERLTAPEQVMAAEVVPVAERDVGAGRDGRDSAVRFVDGLITDLREVPLILLSADCALVGVYDPEHRAIGVVHAGWQGTVAGAAINIVRQMAITYQSDIGRLHAVISPCAGPQQYEVGEIVQRIARSRLPDADECIRSRRGQLMLDLWAANRNQLLRAGMRADHIEVAGLCSITDERFWSHRRDGASAGRFSLVMGLTAD